MISTLRLFLATLIKFTFAAKDFLGKINIKRKKYTYMKFYLIVPLKIWHRLCVPRI